MHWAVLRLAVYTQSANDEPMFEPAEFRWLPTAKSHRTPTAS
jgi:hypothetical protein